MKVKKFSKISLIGMPSAGKTSTSDILGERLGWKVYHLDEMVEQKEGKDLISIWKERGAQYFLDLEANMLSKIPEKEKCIISPAGSIIFSEKGIKWLKENTLVVFLDSDIKTIKKRLSQKPKVVVGGEDKTIEQVHKERLPSYRKYADISINPKDKDVEKIVNEILEKIKRDSETIVIEPLSKRTLKGALDVLDKVFGNNEKDKTMYHNAFTGSLNMKKYKLLYNRKEKPTYLQYYVAIDKKSGNVVGTTGLYAHSELKSGRMGTGWFCVDPIFRGKGIGKMLLDFTIKKAREREVPILFLWTTDDPSEKVAHEMYARRGFKIVKREKSPDYKYDVISMELRL